MLSEWRNQWTLETKSVVCYTRWTCTRFEGSAHLLQGQVLHFFSVHQFLDPSCVQTSTPPNWTPFSWILVPRPGYASEDWTEWPFPYTTWILWFYWYNWSLYWFVLLLLFFFSQAIYCWFILNFNINLSVFIKWNYCWVFSKLYWVNWRF